MAYTIKSGDTLSAIAVANKTTVAELMKLNPQITDANKIYAGASLNLPSAPAASQTLNIPASSGANAASTTAVAGAKPAPAPAAAGAAVAPAPTPAAAPSGSVYTIQSGDTLSALAKKYNTTVAELMKLNPQITNPNLIYAGKSLNLPGGLAGEGSNVSDFSNVNTLADANKVINENQKEGRRECGCQR